MQIKEQHLVKLKGKTYRFNTYCEEFITSIPSRKGVKKAIKRGELLLNNKKTDGGVWLKEGDRITIVDLERTPPKEYHLKLSVVFEDEDMAVVIKPAGINVSGNQFKTIQNALVYNITKSTLPDALDWALPVHRLDNPTSGLLLVAKTKTARKKLGLALEQKTIQKTYHALVIGDTPLEGKISTPIESKSATTLYKKIKTVKSLKNDSLTLLELKPLTGRTHQLRIHCSSIGFPILGDKLYGTEGLVLKNKGLFLSAVSITFAHPRTNVKQEISIPTPYKFVKRMENEQKRYNNYYPQ